MSELRAVLEREIERVDVRPFTLDSFHQNIQHARRRQRLAAGALGLTVAIAASVFAVRAFEELAVHRDPGAPEGAVRFVSAFYGYSVDHPEGWRVKPALIPWTSGELTSELLDRVVDPDSSEGILLEVASIEVPEGMTADAWQDREERRRAYALGFGASCEREHGILRTQVDGIPGRFFADCGLVTVVTEGRGYVIRLNADVATRLDLRDVLTSIRLHPRRW